MLSPERFIFGGDEDQQLKGSSAGMGLLGWAWQWSRGNGLSCASGPLKAELLLQLIFSSSLDPPAYAAKSQVDSSLQEEHVFKIRS